MMNHQNLDLRDVVKDSMYREARGLSHKTTTKKEALDDVVNFRESHKVYPKLQEADWYCDEPRELLRSKSCQFKDGFSLSVSKDYPRFKELPRLSLDSRERSIRTLPSVSLIPIKSSDPKSNLSKDPKFNNAILARPPSVVAKLMGLETFPDLSLTSKNKKLSAGPIGVNLVEDRNSFSKSLYSTEQCGSSKMPNSTKIPEMKQFSRVPMEPAPWKQRDGGQSPQKPSLCGIKSSTFSTKTHIPFSSVYKEVDKRLKNLEFAQSGKDLRALKQILEAMQAVEARKSERQDTHTTSACNESNVSRTHESHIVIMKPAKFVKKGLINSKTGKDPIIESKPRKQSKKQQSESRSLSEKRRPQNDDQNRGIGSESRKLSCRESQMSEKVNGGRVLKMDAEVNASEYVDEINSRQSCSPTQEKSTLLVKVGESLTPEHQSPVSVLDDSVYMDNLPSPVKHTLNIQKDDATQHPAQKTVKDRYGTTTSTDDLSSTIISNVASQINREKLQKIENLVIKLRNLNSSHDESHIDYIASLCEDTNTNPNNRYISEIFLASGLLLRDIESFEFHSSDHPINPQLFMVLEHTKFRNSQKEKFHRKLIFDAVNEILVGKLQLVSRTLQNPRKLLQELCLEIEQVLVQKKREGCGLGEEDGGLELESILREDVLKRSENWVVFDGESTVIAVEVERLIFKDLVNEVVMSKACDGGGCR